VRASNQTGDSPARYAVDGGEKEWSAGNYPPQWLEIDLQEPTTVGQVGFTVGQWPPGYTHHQVWARLADNRYVLLADFNGFTTVDMSLNYKLPVPVQDVTSIRFLQLTSPSWAGYREVEVISAPPAATEACFAKANSSLRLTNYPADDARDIGNLKSGDEIYLGSVYRDDNGVEWARLGNNAWVKTEGLTIGSGCDSANVPEADPGPRLAAVTFNVTVPENTQGEVFIAGIFQRRQPARVDSLYDPFGKTGRQRLDSHHRPARRHGGGIRVHAQFVGDHRTPRRLPRRYPAAHIHSGGRIPNGTRRPRGKVAGFGLLATLK
jgi:hypothetical protein